MGLSMWQVMLVLLIVILLFGRGRIPALMGDVASGIRSFKQGLQDEKSDTSSQSSTEQKIEHKSGEQTASEQDVTAEQKNA
ncbi:twin-arginine translocase TatA/TatE family subunit [Salinimonas chungwhensis]|uniref:twin-arginine translocase TatA/TatE family subunit n=1 Tax=Salinimonas chungwhensis TaxID=265425 RepID=UPI0004779B4A|nr:twin-arginine translocase TatA/TatE family subunit [Salinimonas chungwhensis]